MAGTSKTNKSDNDAYAYLTNELKSWGLSSLASTVWGYLQKGYSNDRIVVELQNTAAYKQRFSGNAARVKAGLAPLNPADYLAAEESYHQVLQAAGLPAGFYDSPSDYAGFIGKDISATEVQDRATAAQNVINNVDPNVAAQLNRLYAPGELTAYFLNPAKTVQILNRQAAAAQAAASGQESGFTLSKSLAEQVGTAGMSQTQSNQQFAQTRAVANQTESLSDIYGGNYTDDSAVQDTILGNAAAAQQRKKLAARETAAFGGSSGLGSSSLGKAAGGNV